MKNRQYIKVIALLLGLIGISALLIGAFRIIENVLDKFEDDGFSFEDSTEDALFYESEWYVKNDSIESYLFLGIDKMIDDSTEQRENSEQADFLAILVLDKDNKKFNILQLNRDTMADIVQKDISGKEYGTVKAQLALSHTYGENDRERCRTAVKAVEDLLYGIDIDHYLSITMDAVPILNDSVGGVELALMDDFTQLDKAFVKDAVVTLRGQQALSYVRARSSLEDSTNLHRMERQRQYLTALFEKFKQNEDVSMIDTVTKINDYLVSDCTVDQMSLLMERLESYTYEDIIALPGESVMGDRYVEFYLDEAAARATVVDLFYERQK